MVNPDLLMSKAHCFYDQDRTVLLTIWRIWGLNLSNSKINVYMSKAKSPLTSSHEVQIQSWTCTREPKNKFKDSARETKYLSDLQLFSQNQCIMSFLYKSFLWASKINVHIVIAELRRKSSTRTRTWASGISQFTGFKFSVVGLKVEIIRPLKPETPVG